MTDLKREKIQISKCALIIFKQKAQEYVTWAWALRILSFLFGNFCRKDKNKIIIFYSGLQLFLKFFNKKLYPDIRYILVNGNIIYILIFCLK